jgi:hypothetical protein
MGAKFYQREGQPAPALPTPLTKVIEMPNEQYHRLFQVQTPQIMWFHEFL